jgi:ADP-heptose:LPS heptosyltransferase
MDKNFKIWGVSYGLIGDLVMGLPALNYFEKLYPGSYKIWVIQKKVAYCAPLYLNHPLIDNIHITEEWNGFSSRDVSIAMKCDVTCNLYSWQHSSPNWYNEKSVVEETAFIAGITDLSILTEEEKKPKLYRWFDPEMEESQDTYSGSPPERKPMDTTVAIFPYSAGKGDNRTPGFDWWFKYCGELYKIGVKTLQFGNPHLPKIAVNQCKLPFFNQMKAALCCDLAIGGSSGVMYVLAAYGHPCIDINTNWLKNHNRNFMSIAPVGDEVHTIFKEGEVPPVEEAIEKTKELLGRGQ